VRTDFCIKANVHRTIKEATVRRRHYDDHDKLERHLGDFIAAYNSAGALKTLKDLKPYEFICKCWAADPHRFKVNPLQQMLGLNMLEAEADMICLNFGWSAGGAHGL
jgi:hypothetical protein